MKFKYLIHPDMILGYIIVIVFLLFSYASLTGGTVEDERVHLDLDNFTATIDIINENCGSSFITKQYGEERYSVYANVCLDNGYCKYRYIPVEDCL